VVSSVDIIIFMVIHNGFQVGGSSANGTSSFKSLNGGKAAWGVGLFCFGEAFKTAGRQGWRGESVFDMVFHGWVQAISLVWPAQKSVPPLPGKPSLHDYHHDVIEPILLTSAL